MRLSCGEFKDRSYANIELFLAAGERLIRILLCIAFLACMPGCLSADLSKAEPAIDATQRDQIDLSIPDTSSMIPSGWRETVLSVTDLDSMVEFYVENLGWQERSRGEVSAALLRAWALPADTRAQFALVANPNTDRGFVRIVSFKNVEQVRIRDHAQAWETGGIYNMNIRVANMHEMYRKVGDAGWQAPSAPVRFVFGPFDVWEWIPRHSDGVRIALSERVAPPLKNWPHLAVSSRAFNSTQIVADFDRAIAFYQGVLGFQTYLDHRGASTAPAEHVLGMSREAMMSITREVRIVNPSGKSNDGSIELLHFEDYTGRDFSELAVPPNLGNLMLRFPVPDVDSLVHYFQNNGIEPLYVPVTVRIPPYGMVKIVAIRAPDGAWLEFFEEL